MKYSISLYCEGDREVKLEEVVALADAVAVYSGIASGAGTFSYGAQILVDAENTDFAVEMALEIFAKAVATASLPAWPVLKAETMSQDEDWEDAFDK